ncbi:TetR family transcriptional regulator [Aureimonas endophytica]|uniref:TetR family transcriptional regulator n=1 Tax=Aureimonas endophytica TaxID=2027858 RepID=A0A917E665_9HYPH|nr:TetR/AcrR family transcriptional regulator [Aureimonas endophytica]GGE04600.1 TetR family transcriptional regulator [Aureimonas endophytica]
METSTADRILDVTQSLLIAGGYHGFSYADIAAVVGIRKASIHHHYPTKADLVAALVRRYVGQTQAGLSAIRRHVAGPAAQLDAYLGYWRKCVQDATQPFCVCAMLASELPSLPASVAAEVRLHFQALVEWLAATLAAGAEQGSLRLSGKAEEEAQVLMATVHGALLSARAFGDPELFQAIVTPPAERLRA